MGGGTGLPSGAGSEIAPAAQPYVGDPKLVPDFYGYGSDIAVNLDTGKTVERLGPLRLRLGDLWAIVLTVFVGLPILAWLFVSGEYRKGSMSEWDAKVHEKGCDCGVCCRAANLKRRA